MAQSYTSIAGADAAVAVDGLIPQRTMRPSLSVSANNWTRGWHQADPISHTRPSPSSRHKLLISRPAEGRRLSWHDWCMLCRVTRAFRRLRRGLWLATYQAVVARRVVCYKKCLISLYFSVLRSLSSASPASYRCLVSLSVRLHRW